MGILKGAVDVLADEGSEAIVVFGVPVAARRGFATEGSCQPDVAPASEATQTLPESTAEMAPLLTFDAGDARVCGKQPSKKKEFPGEIA